MFFDIVLAEVFDVASSVSADATEEALFQMSLEVQFQIVLPGASVFALGALKEYTSAWNIILLPLSLALSLISLLIIK